MSLAAGKIHCSGEGADEDLPDDLEDEGKYVEVPGKRDLELGRSLALRFANERLPKSFELVEQYFHRKGAYSRFKALLERSGQLEAWYEYEERAVEEALAEWCEANDLVLDRARDAAGTARS